MKRLKLWKKFKIFFLNEQKLIFKCPDKSTTGYEMLDFKSDIKIYNGLDISANWTLNFAKVCLGVSTYNVQLPDIYV